MVFDEYVKRFGLYRFDYLENPSRADWHRASHPEKLATCCEWLENAYFNGCLNLKDVSDAFIVSSNINGKSLINRSDAESLELRNRVFHFYGWKLVERIDRSLELRNDIAPKAAADLGMQQMGWLN